MTYDNVGYAVFLNLLLKIGWDTRKKIGKWVVYIILIE